MFADSYDPHSNLTFRCQDSFTAVLIAKDNMTLFSSGFSPATKYSVNYPKPLNIPLSRFAFGPNVQYQVKAVDGTMPVNWVNKVNRTKVTMDHMPSPGDIKFFHTDVIPRLGEEVVIYYYQDSQNNTHVSLCTHTWFNATMNCTLRQTYNHTSAISAFTSAYF